MVGGGGSAICLAEGCDVTVLALLNLQHALWVLIAYGWSTPHTVTLLLHTTRTRVSMHTCLAGTNRAATD